MSPALGMHPSTMPPHLQQLQAHLLRSAAAVALLPHHPLQPPAPHPPPPPHPHSHPHAHGLSPHSQLYAGVPSSHSTPSATLGPHGAGALPKSEVNSRGRRKDASKVEKQTISLYTYISAINLLCFVTRRRLGQTRDCPIDYPRDTADVCMSCV